jgi:hypothetical protein
MTPDESLNDAGARLDPHSEIDALLDGEPVDKQRLRAALDDDGARDYLVEALVLRQITREMEPSRFVIPGTRRGPFYTATRWLAAGVLLAIGLGAGYAYGQVSRPPVPSTGSVEVVFDAPAAAPPAAPEPTRTIRFEPGVNWTTTPRSH